MAAIDWIKKYVGGGQGAGGWDIVSPEGVHVVCGLHQSQANDALRLIQTVLQPTCVPNIDTQRLDWLEDQCRNKGTDLAYNTEYGRAWIGLANGKIEQGFTLREAIDKAMGVPSPEQQTEKNG